jgi:GDSL-like Lipase/Acylhydrolase.
MTLKRKLLFLTTALMLSSTIHAQSAALAPVSPGVPTWPHPWYGARVAYLGDSLTDPRNSGSKKKYWGFLESYLHITPFVYGISGRQWNDIPNQAQKLKLEHGNNFDAIIILVGTNDYNHGVRIGQWYEERDTMVYAAVGKPKKLVSRRYRTISLDPATYRGRINIAMKLLKEMFTDKQIVLLTPLHRALFDANDKNVQPDERVQNLCGEYLDAYVESVKEAGNIWSVPVVDLNATSGLYPLVNGTTYFHTDKDLLHPNDAGQDRMARTLMYQLLSLPCKFGN